MSGVGVSRGGHVRWTGTNFALFNETADRVELFLFDDDLAALAIGLLDRAKSSPSSGASTGNGTQNRALGETGIKVVEGEPVAFLGEDGHVRAVRLNDGETVDCDMVFCTVGQVQHSDLPRAPRLHDLVRRLRHRRRVHYRGVERSRLVVGVRAAVIT